MARRTRNPRTHRPPRTAQRRGTPSAPHRRTDLPVVMLGATRFTDDRSELNARWAPQVLQTDERLENVWTTLREGTTGLAPEWGRRRDPGFYALAFLNFADSKQVDVEPWWTQTNDPDWQAWGFNRRPKYQTVMERFVELETEAMDAFRAAARDAIRYVDAKSGGMVARDIHTDACEDQAHAQLQHDCRPGDNCAYERDDRRRHRRNETPRQAASRRARAERRRIARQANNGANDDVADLRQADNDKAPSEDDDTPLVGDAEETEVDPRTGGIRVKVAGHWWRLLDETAGVRAYVKGNKRKFWVGHLNVKSVCHTFVSMRPKRKGKDWKQLRCYAALIIEWLKIAYRYGYLDGRQRTKPHEQPTCARPSTLPSVSAPTCATSTCARPAAGPRPRSTSARQRCAVTARASRAGPPARRASASRRRAARRRPLNAHTDRSSGAPRGAPLRVFGPLGPRRRARAASRR